MMVLFRLAEPSPIGICVGNTPVVSYKGVIILGSNIKLIISHAKSLFSDVEGIPINHPPINVVVGYPLFGTGNPGIKPIFFQSPFSAKEL
jgi:hypothetical protein